MWKVCSNSEYSFIIWLHYSSISDQKKTVSTMNLAMNKEKICITMYLVYRNCKIKTLLNVMHVLILIVNAYNISNYYKSWHNIVHLYFTDNHRKYWDSHCYVVGETGCWGSRPTSVCPAGRTWPVTWWCSSCVTLRLMSRSASYIIEMFRFEFIGILL